MVEVTGTGGLGGQGRTIVDSILIKGEDRTRAAYASAARNAENAAKRMQQAFQRSMQQRLTSRGSLGPGAQAAAVSGAPAAQRGNAASRISYLVGEMRNLSKLGEAGRLTPEHLTSVRGVARGYSKSGADMGPHMTKFMAAFERHLTQWTGNIRNSSMAAEQLENASRNAADALKGIRTAKTEADKERLAKQYLQSANILKQHDKAVGKDTTELLQHAKAVERGLGGAGKKFHPFTPITTWHGAGTLTAIERASSAMQGFSATMSVFSGNLEQLVYAPFFLRFSELSTFFAAAGIGGIAAMAAGLVKAGNAAKETTLRMEAMVHSEEDRNRILEESYRIAIRTGDSWDRVRLAMADMHAKNIQFHDETFEILLDFAKARPGVELEQILNIFQKAANITPARIEQLHQIGFKTGKDEQGLYSLSLGANTVSGIDRNDQQQLLEAMTTLAKMQHGGFAERFGFTTLAGQMGHLKNAAGDLARVLGRDLDASLSGLLRPIVWLSDRVRDLAMAFEFGDRRARLIVSVLSGLVKIGMVLGTLVFGRVLLRGIRATTAAISAQIIPANVLAGSLHNLGSASARASVLQGRLSIAFGGLSILFGILGEQTGWVVFRWLELIAMAGLVVSALVPYTAWMKLASLATTVFGKVSIATALRGIAGLAIGFRALAASLLSSFALGGPIMWALFGVGAIAGLAGLALASQQLAGIEDPTKGDKAKPWAKQEISFDIKWPWSDTEGGMSAWAEQKVADLLLSFNDLAVSVGIGISWPWSDTEGGFTVWAAGLFSGLTVYAAVVLSDLWSNITEKWNEFKIWLKTNTVSIWLGELWGNIVEKWNAFKIWLKTNVVSVWLGELWGNIVERWNAFKIWLQTNVVSIWLGELWSNITEKWDGFKTWLQTNTVSVWLGELWANPAEKWTAFKEWLKTNTVSVWLGELWANPTEKWNEFKVWLKTNTVSIWLGDLWANITKKWAEFKVWLQTSTVSMTLGDLWANITKKWAEFKVWLVTNTVSMTLGNLWGNITKKWGEFKIWLVTNTVSIWLGELWGNITIRWAEFKIWLVTNQVSMWLGDLWGNITIRWAEFKVWLLNNRSRLH